AVKRCVDGVGHVQLDERVSVGWRAHHLLGGEIAGGADTVLDDELLPEPLGEPLRHQARGEIATAAGRKADDKTHRPRGLALRPSLRRSHPRDDRQRGRARGQAQEFAAENFHDVTLRTHSALRRAVTSISIFMRGSDRPAWIIVAAGLTSPKYALSTGQHGSK